MEVSRGKNNTGGLDLCSAAWLSNHYHLLAIVHRQQELSRFMHHLGCNISKEIGGRLRGWRGAFWERRYDGIIVSDEPDAQWRALKYHLSHSVKEGLTESPLDWPGVHAAKALVHGEALEGYWFNRSKEWSARNRGKDYGRYDFATRYLIRFAQLPAFRHLSPEVYQDRVAQLIREIEEGEVRLNLSTMVDMAPIRARSSQIPPNSSPPGSVSVAQGSDQSENLSRQASLSNCFSKLDGISIVPGTIARTDRGCLDPPLFGILPTLTIKLFLTAVPCGTLCLPVRLSVGHGFSAPIV